MASESPPIEPAQAGALKEEGNKLFLAGKFEAALEKYNKAVDVILRSSNDLPMTLMQSIACAGLMADSPDTVLFYAHALAAFPFRVPNINVFCAVLKLAHRNGGMETGLWLLGVLCRETMCRHDVPREYSTLISHVLADYKQEFPDQVEQCISAPSQSAFNQGMQALLSRRALERCRSAVNSFRGDGEQTLKGDPSSWASAPATRSCTVQLKEEGDRERDSKNYAAAVAKWREALSGFVLLPILLNNVAQVFVKMQAENAVLLNALAVLALQPSNAKAYARAATVALSADWLQAAADCATEGLRHSPAHPDLLRIRKQASATLRRSGTTAGVSKTRPAAPQSAKGRGVHARASLSPGFERKMHDLETTDHSGPEPHAMMRSLLEQMAQQQPQKLRSIERHAGPIPDDFCKSFLSGRVLPAGCRKAVASNILFEGSSQSFAGWEALFYASPGASGMCSGAGSQDSNPGDLGSKDPIQFASEGVLVKRLLDMSPERLRWFKDAPIGALNYVKRVGYPDNALASFTNVAQHALDIPAAGTHVDVGFVDLGVLAATVQLHQSAAAQTDPKSAADTETDGMEEALRWVGIDQSAFCCAKTLVILKMMEEGVDSCEIVQVWYSAGWSAATLHDFHACVAALLEDPSASAATTSAEARQWLQAWHGTTVPLATARATWANRTLKSQTWIGNLLRKDDRMAACAYAVSGDVLFPESPESSRNLKAGGRSDNGKDSKLEVSTGSVVMFPDSIRGAPAGEYALNESFLYVVPPEELIAERLQGNNLLLAAAVCVRRRVEALARALRDKHVTCEVWHTRLAADTVLGADTPQINGVRALEATSMSWSNFCDYMKPSELTQLLRGCAKPGCPQFMHSVNWILDIKGSFIVDYGYPASSSKKGVAQAKERVQVLKDARKLVSEDVKALRVERLMRAQPMENPMSVCEVLLAQRMLPKWLEGLTSGVTCSGKGTGVTFEVLHAPQYWIFSRVYSVAHFVLRCGVGSK